MSEIALSTSTSRLGYQALLLGAVCGIAGLLLVAGDISTRETIARHAAVEERERLAQVLPATLHDNDPLQEREVLTGASTAATEGFDAPVTVMTARLQGRISARVYRTSVRGWGGAIELLVSVRGNGEVSGVRVISHHETPGLADRIEIEKDAWISGFAGRSLTNTPASRWAVRKDGGDFDQFTGATITPRAVVRGVYQTVRLHATLPKEEKP